MNESMLIWSVLFGGVGIGFFSYGRKQKAVVPLVIGLALMAFPYFMPSTTVLVLVGAILLCIPYFIRV